MNYFSVKSTVLLCSKCIQSHKTLKLMFNPDSLNTHSILSQYVKKLVNLMSFNIYKAQKISIFEVITIILIRKS